MSYFSWRDINDLKPSLEKIVYKIVGASDSSIISLLENSLHNGSDRRKTIDKLLDYTDSKKAGKLYDKLESLIDDYKIEQKSRKRIHEDDSKDRDSKKLKTKIEKDKPTKDVVEQKSEVEKPTFTTNKIKQMMANAQKEIEERKRSLNTYKSTKDNVPIVIPPGVEIPAPPPGSKTLITPVQLGPPVPSKPEDLERAKKIAELQAQIRAKLSGTLAGILPQPVPIDKPKPLILDSEGRTVDKAGRAINIPTLAPTLKANIRAKKRENFKANQVSDKSNLDASEASFFDERILLKPALRNKRALRFHEPGKFQQMAERLRMKSQLEKLQNEISQIARKTGISSATKLALIAPKQDLHSDEVPQMEWWDSVILVQDLNTLDANNKIAIRESAISNLIEHPTQMRPPSNILNSILLFVY